MSTEYAAALQGHSFDLDDLRRWYSSGPVQVTDIEVPPAGRVTVLLARDFDGLTSGDQVQAQAWRLIGLLNGILFASSADRSPVRVVGVYKRAANGEWKGDGAYATGRAVVSARVRAYSEAPGPEGLPVPVQTPRQIAWLALAAGPSDPNPVADVLRALRGI